MTANWLGHLEIAGHKWFTVFPLKIFRDDMKIIKFENNILWLKSTVSSNFCKKKKKKEKEKVFKYLVKLTGKQMHYRRDSCIDVFL